MAICERAWDMFSNGEEFLTEAVLEDHQARADLFNLDYGFAEEVAVSESIQSLAKKETVWKRHGFDMVTINV